LHGAQRLRMARTLLRALDRRNRRAARLADEALIRTPGLGAWSSNFELVARLR